MVTPAGAGDGGGQADATSRGPLAIDALAVLDAMPDPFYAVDPDWRVLYLNRAAEQLWDARQSDVRGRKLTEVFPGFAGSEAHRAMQRALSSGQPQRLEVVSCARGLPIELDLNPMPWGLGVHVHDLTRHRQMEERLRDRDELLTLAEDSAGVGIWEVDTATDTVRGTPQFFRIMGLEPTTEAVPMARMRALRIPEDRERLLRSYHQMLRQGDTNEMEYRIRRPDGALRWVFGRGRVFRDASGKPVRYSGVDVDVTGRRMSEAALRESEDRFRRVFEQSPLGKATLGPDFSLREINPAFCRMLGCEAEELVGRNLLDIVHPDHRETCYAQGRALLSGEIAQIQLEERFMRKTGEAFWVSVNVGPIRDATGQVLYTLGIIEDIDERRRIREALQASEQRLRELNEHLEQQVEERARQLASSQAQLHAFFVNSPDWLTLQRVLPNGRIEYADLNPASEIGYGKTRDQVIGRTLDEVLGPEQAQLPFHHLRECVRTGQPQRYLARRMMAGRTTTIDVMFVLVPGQDEHGARYIITTARDLTEREHLEAQLRQAQKMEAIGQLTGGVAHDFNNLLSVVMGSAELARRRSGNAPALMDNILRAGERGVALTRQLLSFSRRQPADPQVLDLRVELPRIAAMLRASLRGDIALRAEAADDVWLIEADPSELEIALLNVAVNARDAMPDGGQFEITVCNADAQTADAPAGEHVVIVLRDTGVGISAELIGKVFDPFFTTKQPGSGTGLGLSQVYGFAQQSGGTVRIASVPGNGTSITLYLPRSTKRLPEKPSATAAGLSGARGHRVLLVEDNPEVAQVTGQMLQAMGLDIAVADRARSALALLNQESFDLMLSDVVMPDGMNGLDLAKAVRARLPDMPILLTSGYTDMVGVEGTGFRLLRKPVPYADLLEAVSACLPGALLSPGGTQQTRHPVSMA